MAALIACQVTRLKLSFADKSWASESENQYENRIEEEQAEYETVALSVWTGKISAEEKFKHTTEKQNYQPNNGQYYEEHARSNYVLN